MANYNKIIMIGNLTRDPQLSYLPSNTPVVEFGLASNRKWKDQSGQMREDTCFIDCRAYGRPAETISKYTSKGRQILIEGRLQLDQWQDKDGNRRSKHRIFVENFQFLDSRAQPAPAARARARAAGMDKMPRPRVSSGRPPSNNPNRATTTSRRLPITTSQARSATMTTSPTRATISRFE